MFSRVLHATLYATEFLHSNAVNKCDVILSNIMLGNHNIIDALNYSVETFHHHCQKQVIKLIDFGISRTYSEDNNVLITALINRADDNNKKDVSINEVENKKALL